MFIVACSYKLILLLIVINILLSLQLTHNKHHILINNNNKKAKPIGADDDNDAAAAVKPPVVINPNGNAAVAAAAAVVVVVVNANIQIQSQIDAKSKSKEDADKLVLNTEISKVGNKIAIVTNAVLLTKITELDIYKELVINAAKMDGLINFFNNKLKSKPHLKKTNTYNNDMLTKEYLYGVFKMLVAVKTKIDELNILLPDCGIVVSKKIISELNVEYDSIVYINNLPAVTITFNNNDKCKVVYTATTQDAAYLMFGAHDDSFAFKYNKFNKDKIKYPSLPSEIPTYNIIRSVKGDKFIYSFSQYFPRLINDNHRLKDITPFYTALSLVYGIGNCYFGINSKPHMIFLYLCESAFTNREFALVGYIHELLGEIPDQSKELEFFKTNYKTFLPNNIGETDLFKLLFTTEEEEDYLSVKLKEFIQAEENSKKRGEEVMSAAELWCTSINTDAIKPTFDKLSHFFTNNCDFNGLSLFANKCKYLVEMFRIFNPIYILRSGKGNTIYHYGNDNLIPIVAPALPPPPPAAAVVPVGAAVAADDDDDKDRPKCLLAEDRVGWTVQNSCENRIKLIPDE